MRSIRIICIILVFCTLLSLCACAFSNGQEQELPQVSSNSDAAGVGTSKDTEQNAEQNNGQNEEDEDYIPTDVSFFSYRTLEDGTVEITKYKGKEKDVCIPAEIDSVPVTQIGVAAFAKSAITSVRIPDSVVRICDRAFSNCASLKQIDFGSVQHIGKRSFYLCSALEYIDLPESLITIDDEAFSNCSALLELYIPKNVVDVGIEAFKYCIMLKKVYTGDNLVGIERKAFFHCHSLTDLTFGPNLYYITNNGFSSCVSLETVVFPEGLDYISRHAFQYCSSLKSATIPESVTYIGYTAFKKCHEDFVLYGKAGSAAEEYAELDGVKFVAVE